LRSCSRAQPGEAAVWCATSGCHNVTFPQSGQACAAVLALRVALGTAQRHGMLDADLHDAQQQLARLPAVAIADPQAETAVRLISWAKFGVVKVTANDIDMARLAGMTLMPQISGLALALWPPGCKSAAV